MREQLFSYADANRQFVIDLQRAMTAIPAIGPDNKGAGEADKAAYLKDVLLRLGADEVMEIGAPDARVPGGVRPNLAARIKGKSPRTLWVIGHMDVVPVGEESLWQSPPFEMRQDGDWLIGRGVEDNQQAIASALLAWKVLADNKTVPDLSYGVLLVSDEETHSAYGLAHVAAAAPELISKDDLVLIPDIGDSLGEGIEIAEKGCAWLKFTVSGKQCHASTPDEGVNTLVAASAAILALDALHGLFPQRDELYSPPTSTFVPSKKEANVENINTVPGLDVFYMDCRVLPGIALDEVMAEAARLCKEAVKPYGAEINVEPVFKEQAPPPTPADAPVVTRLLRSLASLRGITGKPRGVGGQTVAAVLRGRGIPAAAWSTILSNAHAPNERSSVTNTVADAKIIVDMLFD